MAIISSTQPTKFMSPKSRIKNSKLRWQINVSACLLTQSRGTNIPSMGAVIRDGNGNWFKGVEALLMHGESELRCAELLAIERVLEYGWELQMPSVVVETDCLLAIKAIDEADKDHVYHGIIQNIRFFIHSLPWNVKIKYVKNETNQVASILAHRRKWQWDTRFIVHDKPPSKVAHLISRQGTVI
ncbi:hypothetical protein POM88_047258 [Heracleum sosnowskyi]|uniref:RNase H type-1 domain-containing protein n=1 Tax=Heracleum sosnowskyi TaxID=360622 RepID=A0AAD8LZG2_9APIA|nr:hypothetical protein POM88_047258 [Heracleum sosnowskyi]